MNKNNLRKRIKKIKKILKRTQFYKTKKIKQFQNIHITRKWNNTFICVTKFTNITKQSKQNTYTASTGMVLKNLTLLSGLSHKKRRRNLITLRLLIQTALGQINQQNKNLGYIIINRRLSWFFRRYILKKLLINKPNLGLFFQPRIAHNGCKKRKPRIR